MEEVSAVIVLVTFSSSDEANRIAEALVSEHLAACVHLFPKAESVYRWKGVVERAQEIAGLIKTDRSRLASLEQRYKAMHSYEVPEFLVISVLGGSSEYLGWLKDNTASASG
jgi:periplasmic divalent cation tolerance protein